MNYSVRFLSLLLISVKLLPNIINSWCIISNVWNDWVNRWLDMCFGTINGEQINFEIRVLTTNSSVVIIIFSNQSIISSSSSSTSWRSIEIVGNVPISRIVISLVISWTIISLLIFISFLSWRWLRVISIWSLIIILSLIRVRNLRRLIVICWFSSNCWVKVWILYGLSCKILILSNWLSVICICWYRRSGY